uniref:Uncharacterized protein n=1 Tax=Cryptomonas curvata TaxID=233186 RepID=A0A7S0N8I0_9CRYP|mmetsp:Transcript_8214/g.17612  ORF Transcript_8214/g.17612 Transcript_8214/m.17612 type:complete len:189 (+) Transcript_8214:36-602(+)
MGNASSEELCGLVGCSKQFRKSLPSPSLADNSRRRGAPTCVKPTVAWQTSRIGIRTPQNLVSSPEEQDSGPEEFRPKQQMQESFHNAAEVGDVAELCHILEFGRGQIDINGMDHRGNTALHKAAFQGHLDVCNTLCKHGAAVDIVNQCSLTPFDIAIRRGNKACAKAMRGSSPSNCGSRGASPFPSPH